MKSDILKLLLQSHVDGDETSFRRAALQLAAAESSAGHVHVAEEIRAIVGRMSPVATRRQAVVDIAQPRGELADILEGGHRDEKLADIILRDDVRALFQRLIVENRSRQRLERFGVGPRRRVLFEGPPDCGKTLAAAVLAGELGLPLMTVRLDALFSRFLGATASHLRTVFAEMPRRPGVYLFDEVDSLVKARGDSHDVGEVNRVVTAFLQLLDADQSASILVAATNHIGLLDRAVFRRFDVIVPFQPPGLDEIRELLLFRLRYHGLSDADAVALTPVAAGWSFADLARACDDALRTMALDDRDRIAPADVAGALAELHKRRPDSGG